MRNPNCQDCDLHSSCKTVCLWGNPLGKAKVMLVGEAPGRSEDQIGIPFVGQAGKLLRTILDDLGAKDYYITNAVKCRPDYGGDFPKENRKPYVKETRACRKYLLQEIEEVEPELIVALGDSANTSITGRKQHITDIHGNFQILKFRGRKIDYMVTYHPAAVLRNEYLLRFLVSDLKKAFFSQREEKEEIPEPVIVKSLPKVSNLVIDLETDGFDPHSSGKKILLAGAYDGKNMWVVDVAKYGANGLRGLNGKEIIGQNIKFDLHWLLREGITPTVIGDTMIAAGLYDILLPEKNLGFLSQYFLGKKTDEIDFKKTPAAELYLRNKQKLINHLVLDCVRTAELNNHLLKLLAKENLLKQYEFMLKVLPVLAEIEKTGVTISKPKLYEVRDNLNHKKVVVESQFKEIAKAYYGKEVNPQSTKQLAQFFNKTLKIPKSLFKTTKKGSLSTNESSLSQMLPGLTPEQRKPVELLLEHRKLTKLLATYVANYDLPSAGDTVLIHPNYNQLRTEFGGTVTYRLSCVKPNFQNIPREGGGIREVFVSRFKDGLLMEIDYSQIELRLVAHLANDREMLDGFRRGVDFHQKVADDLGISRQDAKTTNFAILYFITGYGLARQLGIGETKAESIISKWWDTHPQLKAYFKQLVKKISLEEKVYNLFGFYKKVNLGENYKYELRAAKNFPVQSSAVILNLLAMIESHNFLSKNQLQSRIIMQIHDSVVIDCLKKEVNFIAKGLRKIWENPPIENHFPGIKLNVPLRVGIKVGPNLGQMKGV